MSDLIPTPIVDKNGRQTTVHKKAVSARSSKSLSSLKPVLGAAPTVQDQVHVIKGKVLHGESVALQMLRHDPKEQYDLTSSKGRFTWRESVEISNSELYGYLRLGIDVQDAAALKGMGISSRSLDSNPLLSDFFPGRLGKLDKQQNYWSVPSNKVIDRFEAAGISAIHAEKAIGNNIQNAFLDKGLDEHQLLELFSRKRYATMHGTSTRVNDGVVYGFIRGTLPMSVVDIPTSKLSRVVQELSLLKDDVLNEIRADADLFESFIRKSIANNDCGVESLNRLYKKFGPGIMELNDPFLCSVQVKLSDDDEATDGGIDTARYLDRFHKVVEADGNTARDNHKYEWWGGVFVRSRDNVTKADNKDLENLRVHGISPEDSYDGLIIQGLTAEQIIIGQQDSVPQGLAAGAL